jgi:Methyltransferase domain
LECSPIREDRSESVYQLPEPTFTPRRYRAHGFDAWSGHLPFAHDLVLESKPSLLVELGTHYGESYFTFCQTVAQHGLPTRCYAVDHWRGEAHAGVFDEAVFDEVRAHNQELYAGFSYLLRSSFDDAAAHFQPETIDLLHIDGLHTYEAVRHDFEIWFPNVKSGGLILLHDICVRHEDFGVWRLWEELESEFDQTFAFHHSWGLGLLRKPGGASNQFLDLLFQRDTTLGERLRRHYVIYASHLENILEQKPLLSSFVRQAHVQIFRAGSNGYSQEESQGKSIEFEAWHDLSFHFPHGLGSESLRFDPAHCSCLIEIDSVTVLDQESGRIIWQASTAEVWRSFRFSGTALRIPGAGKCVGLSTGNDPQILLPALPDTQEPVSVIIRLRLSRAFDAVADMLRPALLPSEGDELAHLRDQVSRLESALQEERNSRRELEISKSWQLTRPLRALANWKRKAG